MPPSQGPSAPGSASPPLVVAVVAGTRTRTKWLERLLTLPGLVLGGSAQDPLGAEQLVVRVAPNVVLLDLDLWSGGLETIERIMAVRATPIVVIGAAAEHPEAAIAAGAVDVVGGLDVAPGTAEYAQMVMRHLKVASRVRVITHPRGRRHGRATNEQSTQSRLRPVADAVSRTVTSTGDLPSQGADQPNWDHKGGPRLIVIGASTGGPPALATILSEFPPDLAAAVVVVQHMAEGFVEGLGRWLDGICAMPVMVAVEGERLRAGHVYLAPATQNLTIRPGFRVGLADPPPGQYHVPGVDVTFRSVAAVSSSNAVGVLLTGMGRDGAAGLRVLRDAGAFTIGQDEPTSVVWGMPAAAQELDAVDVELPLSGIGAAIVTAVAGMDEPEPVRQPAVRAAGGVS